MGQLWGPLSGAHRLLGRVLVDRFQGCMTWTNMTSEIWGNLCLKLRMSFNCENRCPCWGRCLRFCPDSSQRTPQHPIMWAPQIHAYSRLYFECLGVVNRH